MLNKVILIVMLFILSACASSPPPVMAPLVQKVEIPIPVPCKVDIPKSPTFNFSELTIDHDIFDKTKALLADIKLHFSYEAELLGALKSCVK